MYRFRLLTTKKIVVCCCLVFLTVMFLSSYLTAESETQVATLLQLSQDYSDWIEARRGQAYLDLLNSTNAEQQAINEDPDIELMYVDTNGEPFYYTITNLNAAKTISTDDVWPGGSGGFNFDGSGTTLGKLGIWDAGAVLTSHQEFDGRVTIADGTSAISFHATHVAGTMVAEGQNANAKGMSPVAFLRSYNWSYDESEMATASANGMNVSNHSYNTICGWRWMGSYWKWYGDSSISDVEDYKFGFYNSSSFMRDEIAMNAPYYLICQSAGNNRTDGGLPGSIHEPDGGVDGYDCLPPKACAKNTLSVGAVGDIPTGYSTPGGVVMEIYSGWGPTDDGRIKPDIVANGKELTSCDYDNNADYEILSGTSMSTPNVSGSANLLFRQYESLIGTTPLASTIKGVIIQTADEAGPNTGPDYMFGWGLMNTREAAELIASNANEYRIIEDELVNGEIDNFYFYSSGTQPIRLTISWTDLPGTSPIASLNPTTLMLVNDLDMRIENIDSSTIYNPYLLDPANPSFAATTGDNFRDNVEQIYIASPPAGIYAVSISHKGTLSSGQHYSLIGSQELALDSDGDGILDDGDLSGSPFDNRCTGGETDSCDDNCMTTYNPDQEDFDVDGIGDACDPSVIYYVPGYVPTIQMAIDLASDGANIMVGPGTYSTAGFYNVDFKGKNVTVKSVNGASETIIDCGGEGSDNRGFIFDSRETSSAKLIGFTVRNGDVRTNTTQPGKNGGAIKIESASPTIKDCIFENNQAFLGGAIHIMKTDTLPDDVYPTITGCVFNSNSANDGMPGTDNNGGAILSINSHPTISNCLFEKNTATEAYGGAIYTMIDTAWTETGTATIDGCTFYGNNAIHGGALYVNGTDLSLAHTVIADTPEGHGIEAWDGSIITYDCNDFWNNLPNDIDTSRGVFNIDANTIYQDPLFCDTANGNFTIAGTSPCATQFSPCDQFIGAYDVGCDYCPGAPHQCGSCYIEHIPGDVNMSGDIDILDIVYLINYVYKGGPEPLPYAIAGDVDCDDAVNILDIDCLINFKYKGGPAPLDCCPESSLREYTSSALKVYPTITKADIIEQYDGNTTTIVLNSEIDLQGLELRINCEEGATITNLTQNLQLFTAEADGWYRVGLLDMSSEGYLATGHNSVIKVTGKARVSEAIGVSKSGTAVGIKIQGAEKEAMLPTAFALHDCYPNPFNPVTTISYDLQVATNVQLVVYNLIGQRVATLVDEHQNAGSYQVDWNSINENGQTVASGIYIYNLTAGSFVETKRMMLLK